nr:MAG TPA: hypothetical protein [Siphoviridae sp. ctX8T1]
MYHLSIHKPFMSVGKLVMRTMGLYTKKYTPVMPPIQQ